MSDILLVVFSLGSAETKAGLSGKLSSHLVASCVRFIRTKKLSKSDNNYWFSSYSRKTRGCFFETQCSRCYPVFVLYPVYTPCSWLDEQLACQALVVPTLSCVNGV